MKKLIACVSLALLMSLGLTACGDAQTVVSPSTASASTAADISAPTPTPSPTPEPALDLTGEWMQVNSESEASYQTATISGASIEVYWVDDDSSTKALYWAGSYTVPSSSDDAHKWDSQNDKEKTGAAMLASGDDIKVFTYEDGQLSYDVSALGVTKTVKLERK